MRTLVTGASSGIGEAVSRILYSKGHEVILVARRMDRLEAIIDELIQQDSAGRDRLRPLQVDLSDLDALRQLTDRVGEIDILVNNAGGALGLSPAQEASLEDWLSMIAVNVTGLVALTHSLLPAMVSRGTGLIINLGSVAGEYPYPGGNVYGACKAFVRQLSLNLKADLIGTGVRVTNIEPGMVGETEFSLVRFQGDSEAADAVYAGMQPLTPADIASLVSYIVDLPSHVNINTVSLMPTDQGFGPFKVARSS